MAKDEASTGIIQYISFFERQTGTSVLALHSDGGTEFKRAQKELKDKGVIITTTTPYTPPSNGLAERSQGSLLTGARSVLSESKLPLTFWVDAIKHVTQCKNAVTHSSTKEIPHERLYRKKNNDLKHIRPFGCNVIVLPNKKSFKKFATRSIDGINLGHIRGGLYKILTKESVIITKHVRFNEEVFSGLSLFDTERPLQDRKTRNELSHVVSKDDDELNAQFIAPVTLEYSDSNESDAEASIDTAEYQDVNGCLSTEQEENEC